ncbi:MAG TPA: protein kinase [Candidatus Eisenbacteria bacterium]|nr:protein kinase [Candidatus Eisenbacteria bacterium]
MTPKRYPWWIVALAAISIIGNCYLGYYLLFGLAPDGVGVEDRSGGVTIVSVDEDGAAGRAGLQVGDELLSVNGQHIGTVADWLAQRMNLEEGKPTLLRVQRGERTVETTMVIRGRIWNDYSQSMRISQIIFLAYKLVTLAIGLFVVFSRPQDFVARLGGWVLVAMATVFEAFQWGLAAAIRELPVVIAAPVLLVYVSAVFRTPLLAAFFSLFPKRLFQNRLLWTLFWAVPLVATLYGLELLVRTVYDPEHLSGLAPPWVLLVFGSQSVAYLGIVLLLLPLSYWRLETPTDRRRFRVLVFGALISMVFYVPRVIGAAFLNLTPGFNNFLDSPAANLVSSAGMLVLPFSFAYAILRQRLFDLRVIVRRGVQYALARRFLLAVPVVALGLLAIDLVAHGNQPLFSVLKQRAATYVAIAALAGLAATQRQTWLSALDRKFFRDKYDAHLLFREILDDIRNAAAMELVAPRVVSRISVALHTRACGLLVRRPSESFYHVVAAAPTGSLLADLPASNKLIPLVRMLECSVPITQAGSGWLGQQLPQVDKDFLRDARIELLVPVALKEGGTEALLVLGGKQSEEPYSTEDIALLENVANALAMLMMRGNTLEAGRAFEECPACGTCYDTGTTQCTKDKSTLMLVASPRLLGGRYRLDSRLGLGGMGKVYRAEDLSLSRAVAVKMIRDDLFASPKAIEKFRQESQLTARFAHPNVVTIYDFGVDPTQRVFLVMELLEGRTLRDELRGKKRLSPERILELFEGICAGVGAAHAQGLIHRDLKPENVFLARVDSREVVKITDFGIAKVLPDSPEDTSDSRTATMAGTLRYMSPEQLRGKGVSQRWDLWALAVVGYEALCGAPPFSGDSFAMLENAIKGMQFIPLSEQMPDAQANWQAFFERAFAPLEEDRPESVAAFWEGLQKALGRTKLQ